LYSFRPVEELARPDAHAQLLREFAVEAHLDPEKEQNFLSPATGLVLKIQYGFLQACTMMVRCYKLLPGATGFDPTCQSDLGRCQMVTKIPCIAPMTREQAFAGIAMFESGTCDVDPQSLRRSFRFVVRKLSFSWLEGYSCDPFEVPASNEVRRVIGNVGRAGLTFLFLHRGQDS